MRTFHISFPSIGSLLSGAAVFLAACLQGGLQLTPGPIKLYEGPDQPTASVAVIENDRNMFLESVDGRSLRRWTQTRDVVSVQVLPGKRFVVAGPSERAGVISMDAVRFEFLAEAGHRYVVSRRMGGGSAAGVWLPVLTDATTGKQVLP